VSRQNIDGGKSSKVNVYQTHFVVTASGITIKSIIGDSNYL